jgi:thiamine-phosphate pyrophosphorylase
LADEEPCAAPRLIIVTDRHATGGSPLVDVIKRALAGLGNQARHVAVQLREKDLSGRHLWDLAIQLRAVTRAAGVALYVNDRVDVALAVEADGVHLGRASLRPSEVKRIAPALRIGVSTHTPEEAEAAAAAGADFALFGPVFETPSKHGILAARGLSGLKTACRPSLPVLALGGIEPHNTPACLQAGAHGVACIRAVLSAPDTGATVRMFLECLDRRPCNSKYS